MRIALSAFLIFAALGLTFVYMERKNGEKTDKNKYMESIGDGIGKIGTADAEGADKTSVKAGGSVPPDEIHGGGPAKDGIPSIDDPLFESVEEANKHMENGDAGLSVALGGEARFYPYKILVWHEIVNDDIAGRPILVSYCPLCRTGIVFDRKVGGKILEFGVSGMLWKSNLLMYDRKNSREKKSGVSSAFGGASLNDFDGEKQSLWSQVLGRAVWGRDAGEKLAIISSDTILFGDWKNKNPGGAVLSAPKGSGRNYGGAPYENYYAGGSAGIGDVNFTDMRLSAQDFVVGIELNGKFKAYLLSSLGVGETEDVFSGEDIKIMKSGIGEIKITDSSGENIPHVSGFWFSWSAAHPETELYK